MGALPAPSECSVHEFPLPKLPDELDVLCASPGDPGGESGARFGLAGVDVAPLADPVPGRGGPPAVRDATPGLVAVYPGVWRFRLGECIAAGVVGERGLGTPRDKTP